MEEKLRKGAGEIGPNPPSVLEGMTEILTFLRDVCSLLFSSLVGGERRRSEVVVTLLAVLELVRLGRIRTQQTELFGEIVIERQTGETFFFLNLRPPPTSPLFPHPALSR